MLRIIPLVLLISSGCWSAEDYSCTEAVCKKQLENKKCASLPSGCSKTDDGLDKTGYYFSSPDACNCCEYCVAWLNEGAGCVVDATGASTPTSMCGPGLSCSNRTKTCEPILSTCTRDQRDYDNDRKNGTLGVARWRPVCDDNGDYSYVKCIPNSICYCVDPQNGTRIFGEKVYQDAGTATSMTCGCSLSAWRASQLGFDVESARCLSDGSFDALQCLGSNCTCVNPIDGALVTSTFESVSQLKRGSLSCFDPTLHLEGKFLRPCEEEKRDLQILIESTDYSVLNVNLPNCSADGQYAPVQIVEGVRRCVDPEGNTIENFQSSNGHTDCQCARTRWLLRENGVQELPTCLADGSYRPWQCWRDICYCVDSNGNQISSDWSRDPLSDLPYFNVTMCHSDKSTF